jgi:ubiquinone/menaquinone biosynthesis C-methylase UbiE
MITTVCFLDDIPKAFAEVNRILKNEGHFIVAIIDKESHLGKLYEEKKDSSPWYKDAHFHTVSEITSLMLNAGFADFDYWQTLSSNNEEMEEPMWGFGKGSFVIIRSQKK